MAERVLDVFKLGAATSGPEQKTMVDRASEIIGSTLIQFLRTARRDDPEVPLYLQIAFQACLTHHICWIISAWTLDEGHSAFINEIYQRLREGGKTPVCEDDQTPAYVQRTINRKADDIWALAFPHACLCPSCLYQRTQLSCHPHRHRTFPYSPGRGLYFSPIQHYIATLVHV